MDPSRILISTISVKGQKALIIGDGSVFSLVQVAKQPHEQGVDVEVVVGSATKEAVIWEKSFSSAVHVTVTTDDGSWAKGYVPTVDQMDQEFDVIYSCGDLACSNMSIP